MKHIEYRCTVKKPMYWKDKETKSIHLPYCKIDDIITLNESDWVKLSNGLTIEHTNQYGLVCSFNKSSFYSNVDCVEVNIIYSTKSL